MLKYFLLMSLVPSSYAGTLFPLCGEESPNEEMARVALIEEIDKFHEDNLSHLKMNEKIQYITTESYQVQACVEVEEVFKTNTPD